ncbi:MAG: hypothetical protein K5981_09110 [Clostridia bacterium]|nr:hypothetical protein [Clostridia bacterium]
MIFQVEYNSNTWVDWTVYAENSNFDGSISMQEGLAAGKAISALRILDDIEEKAEFRFTSTWLTESVANNLQQMLRRRPFRVRTDYFQGTPEIYTVVCDNIQKAVKKSSGTQRFIVSATVKEI